MRTVGIVLVGVLGLACDRSTDVSPTASTASAMAETEPAPTKVDIVQLAGGKDPLKPLVSKEMERAAAEGRDLFIYVGAEWCEPCNRFHDAAARGELDATFPTLRLLELDLDQDRARLSEAGCVTRMIPLFARPNAEGGCDLSRSITGSVKGPGAVANITPRLQQLLTR